jgi:hypothetical protein
MKKDAYYFPHDSNAKDDPKCIMLIEQLGLEGYGIYWVLIETLRDQPGYCYPIQLLPALARRFNTTFEKMKAVVLSYNLFIVKDDILFFSQSLCDRMKSLEDKRVKRSLAGIKGNEKRWGDRIAIAEQSQCDRNSSLVNKSRVKESKVKESKGDDSIVKDYKEKQNRFSAPSKNDIISFLISEKKIKESDVNYYAERFMMFYDSKNWMVGKNKMTNWKTALTRSLDWEDRRNNRQTTGRFGYNEINEDEVLKNIR